MQRAGLIIFAAVCLIGIVLFLRKNEYPIANYPSEGIEIVAFGDSLVEGVGASPDKNFVSLISQRLGIPILNLGKSGDTTASASARFESVMPEHPKLVVVLLGGNDFLHRVPRQQVFENLGIIIEKIEKRGAIVVLLGVQGGVIGDSYDQEYKRLAKKYKTAYVANVLKDIIGHPELMSDTIHPNDKGHAIIAERVYSVVFPLVRQ